MEKEIDTMNRFAVGLQGDKVHIMNSRDILLPMTPQDALNLAAWLVTNAQVSMVDFAFDDVLEAIRNGK